MDDLSVREFAESIDVPPERLLAQLRAAGRTQLKEEDTISDEDRKELLVYLKRIHGKEEATVKAPRAALKRRQVQESSVPASPREGRGPAGVRAGVHTSRKTVKVDVRRSHSVRRPADDHAVARTGKKTMKVDMPRSPSTHLSEDEKQTWSCEPFARHAERLRSVHERVDQLENPSGYITSSTYRGLRDDAQKVRGDAQKVIEWFQNREYRNLERDAKKQKWVGWDTLPDDEKDQRLEAIKDFLKKSNEWDDFREQVNKAFLEKELRRALPPKEDKQLRSIHERVTQLRSPEGPPRYIISSIFHGLEDDAQKVIELFRDRIVHDLRREDKNKKSPDTPSDDDNEILTSIQKFLRENKDKKSSDTLSGDAVVQMLATIQGFLSEPNGGDNLRKKANEAFVEKALGRAPLPEDAEQLRSIHERIAQLDNPPRYITSSIFDGLRDDADKVIKLFRKRIIDHDLKCGDKNEKSLDTLSDDDNEILISIQDFLSRIYPNLKREDKNKKSPDALSGDAVVQMLASIQGFLDNYSTKDDNVRKTANETFVANELERRREFFDGFHEHPLTEEQQHVIVVDEDRNLVVAAAGSGKTSVMVAKAGWILERRDREPSEILMLAFANDAVGEIKKRMKSKLTPEAANQLSVHTFHSLGNKILGETDEKRRSLHKEAEDRKTRRDQIKRIRSELLKEGEIARLLRKWLESEFAPYKPEHEFKTRGDYINYLRQNGVRTLQGEPVKSMEECQVANFLFLNGIEYEYEAKYPIDTREPGISQYKPDFHLTGTNIYIEHFGIRRNGDTAPFVPHERYHQDMRWKQKIHPQHGTQLIETYSYEAYEGNLIQELEIKLKEHGVELKPIPDERIFDILNEQHRTDHLTELLLSFLNHYKSAMFTPEKIKEQVNALGGAEKKRAQDFIEIFNAIYEKYQKELKDSDDIDFHDMINLATDAVEQGRFQSKWKYIMVDEFQDISPGRARLVKALLAQDAESNGGKPRNQLFAVGDDWQSIMRFTGSENAIMRGFEKHFGPTECMDLETTFRCAQPIAELATKFIRKNPSQRTKIMRPPRHEKGPRVHIGLTGRDESLLTPTLDRIEQERERERGEDNATVFVLGRYKHKCSELKKEIEALEAQYPRLKIGYNAAGSDKESATTVHKAKGLEADYVIVTGLNSERYGFPSEIEDDPLLDLVLPESEKHSNAEERRVFYVALTRARRHVFLLSEGDSPSSFITELLDENYDVDVFGRPPEKDVACPTCVKGKLVQRPGNPGEDEPDARDEVFFGCSNWPLCKYKQPSCIECKKEVPVKKGHGFECPKCFEEYLSCPDERCNGRLAPIKGAYGWFLGCTNYRGKPSCEKKRQACPACRSEVRILDDNGKIRCRNCGERLLACTRTGCTGWMKHHPEKPGHYNDFLGCTRHRNKAGEIRCRETLNLDFCDECTNRAKCLRERECLIHSGAHIPAAQVAN